MTNKVFGLAWYREEDYRRILKIMEDADMLPRTYKRWKRLVERGERRQEAAGPQARPRRRRCLGVDVVPLHARNPPQNDGEG